MAEFLSPVIREGRVIALDVTEKNEPIVNPGGVGENLTPIRYSDELVVQFTEKPSRVQLKEDTNASSHPLLGRLIDFAYGVKSRINRFFYTPTYSDFTGK